jgi:hypothetical protein
MMLKFGLLGKYIINTWRALKYRAGEGWRSDGRIVRENKYYIDSRRKGISYMQQEEGGLTG